MKTTIYLITMKKNNLLTLLLLGSCLSVTSAQFNYQMGTDALRKNTTGIHNTAIGHQSMRSNTRGSFNTAFGASALRMNTEGQNNTVVGYQSLYRNTTGKENTSIGANAMNTNATGNYNTGIGTFTLAFSRSGNHNTAVGHRALMSNTSGNSNIAVGGYALQSNETGAYNTAFGYYSLYSNTKGKNNTAVGNKAFSSGFSYNNSTALGANSAISASNQIRIGDTEVKSIGGRVGWTTVSDGRFKHHIQTNVPGLDFINKLTPVTYQVDNKKIRRYLNLSDSLVSDDNSIQSGFIAQEVAAAAEETGYQFSGIDAPKNDQDYYGLRYAEFTVPLVKAVQELSAENEALKEEVATLKAQNKQLEQLQAEVAEIKALLNTQAAK